MRDSFFLLTLILTHFSGRKRVAGRAENESKNRGDTALPNPITLEPDNRPPNAAVSVYEN